MGIIFLGLSVIFSAVSLLFLPSNWLLTSGKLGVIAIVWLGINFWFKTYKLMIYGLILLFSLGYSHSQALKELKIARDNLHLPAKVSTQFQIQKIYHQQDYVTLMATARLPTYEQEQNIYLNWNEAKIPKLGEVWQGTLRLYPLTSRLNFGGFDRQKWYFAQHITAYGSVKEAQKLADNSNFRQQLLALTVQQTEDLSQQGLLLALGFGERGWLTAEVQSLFQRTNTAHLIAISGLHIGLAMVLGFWLGRGLSFILPKRLIYAFTPQIFGLGLALFYTYLAGGSIPTLRAMGALSILLWGQFSRHRLRSYHYLILVVAGLLVCDPLMVLSSSFWLSVGAVGCLMLWYHFFPFRALVWRGQNLPKFWQWLWGLVHLQIGLLWLFTPIQLLLFHGFSTLGLIINLIFVPVFSLVLVPMILVAIAVRSVAFWVLVNDLAQVVVESLQLLANFFITLDNTQIYWLSLLCWGSFGTVVNHHRLSWRSFSVVSGSVMGLAYLFSPANSREIFHFLDVGQGLAVVIEKNKRGILYDTGANWHGGSMAKLEILPWLQREGIQLDYIILSHDDLDHAGGLRDVVEYLPEVNLIAPSSYSLKRLKGLSWRGSFQRCEQNQSFTWQGLELSMLAPLNFERAKRASNAQSCVVLVQDKIPKLLLTGDATQSVEYNLLATYGETWLSQSVAILQVPHHGSLTSSSYSFLQKLKPKLAVVSASRWNQWKLPRREVLYRYESLAIPWLNTAYSGGVEVEFTTDGVRINTARNSYSPWYQELVQ